MNATNTRPTRRFCAPRLIGFVAALLSVGLIATGCDTGDLDESVAGAPRAKSSDTRLNCGDKPDQEQLQAARGASLPQLRAGEPEAKPLAKLAEKIGDDLFDFGADETFGWLLHLLTGENRDNAETAKKIDETYKNSVALRNQVYDLCTSLDQRLQELSAQVNLKAYQDAATNAKANPLPQLNSYQDDYDDVVAYLKGHPTAGLSGDNLRKVDSIRANIVHTVISPLNSLMRSTPDADGLISMYSDVLADDFDYGFAPVRTQQNKTANRILTPDYVNAAYDQVNFYAGAMVQALLLYADVSNIAYTYDNTAYEADPDQAFEESGRVVKYIDAWGAQMWGGRTAPGQTSDWVSHDLGPIPDGTVADLRVQGKPRLWSLAPYAMTGDKAKNPPPYCGRPTTWCWSQLYDGNGVVIDRAPVRPTSGPADRLLSRQAPFGLNDWRVPTKTDWDSLVAGTTGGLQDWGKRNLLPQLAGSDATAHSGGVDRTVSSFVPVLVDLDGQGTSFGTYSAPKPDADTLTLTRSTGDHELAGRLFLARDMPDVAPPMPTKPASARQR